MSMKSYYEAHVPSDPGILKNPDAPDDVVERYSYGRCVWLALALNLRYGWPIFAQVEGRGTPHEYAAHAYVRHPSGVEIDVLGPQDRVDVFASDTVSFRSPDDFLSYIRETQTVGKRMIPDAEIARELFDADEVIGRYIEPHLLASGLLSQGTRVEVHKKVRK